VKQPVRYSFANLGGVELGIFRLRGVGLANCLFPWARCAVVSRKHELARIASTWPQLCHRQWIQGDLDKRVYSGLFDERASTIGGIRKLALLSSLPRVAENDFLFNPDALERGVVTFSGIEGYFETILGDHAFVRDLLFNSTRGEHKEGLRTSHQICVHVRLGDFVEPDTSKGLAVRAGYHVRQPREWFVHIINQIRGRLGFCAPVSVFSDGSDEEIRPLLAMPHVHRISFGSSIADLLALSTAKTLIASSSTFSMWAAFLGRMPVIWPPGMRRQRLYPDHSEYEPEIGFEPLPEQVASVIARHIHGGSKAPLSYCEVRL
jgi:hypothetical protein